MSTSDDLEAPQAPAHAGTSLHGRLSRRLLLRAGVGGVAFAVGVGTLGRPALGAAPKQAPAKRGTPKPIHGIGPMLQVQLPSYKPEGPPAVFEQSSITDFEGLIGSTAVSGWGKGTDQFGSRPMYCGGDMRFMEGLFVDTTGRLRRGTFAFFSAHIWDSVGHESFEDVCDLLPPPCSSRGPIAEVHDINPGYPDGIFLTAQVPANAVRGDGSGALCRLRDVDCFDSFNIANLTARGPNVPARVSYDLRFTPRGDLLSYRHPADALDRDSYTIDYHDAAATLELTVETSLGFRFESFKIGRYPDGFRNGQSFAILGWERNGAFFT